MIQNPKLNIVECAGWVAWLVCRWPSALKITSAVRPQPKSADFHDAKNRQRPCHIIIRHPGVANIILNSVEDARNQERTVLLPKIVEDKGLLESITPAFGDGLRQRTSAETGFGGYRLEAESKNVLLV
ncbi:hypothetical protein TNCV_3677481 [Trichonephila clavipes]|nr:hypothetical protein TNCV_3677481 [Trichonephila clavipes]